MIRVTIQSILIFDHFQDFPAKKNIFSKSSDFAENWTRDQIGAAGFKNNIFEGVGRCNSHIDGRQYTEYSLYLNILFEIYFVLIKTQHQTLFLTISHIDGRQYAKCPAPFDQILEWRIPHFFQENIKTF